ncbi:lysophospholipid acyltransferase family protein [Desulfofundulus thermosubterraneus]|uniref:1-acyl-sn-glycerol-3-phosphate acyltransferase n=1 Tax=Desulfofundulus thermosubterraneus DSM 16057 TaxID=1121432 RepID=A0A1M6HHK8_9FIRM|nr:lysophospholipid acyltransferase family protein [Desulfofundulus thermosubterraneus]SHJ21653.1 1-acyl-sn-glycerol-3-phosphate acyltransferase [Desulfofundulus thermosubterraneus DSM 16057]
MFYRFARALCRVILALVRRWEVVGAHNLPPSGGVLVVSNHVSYWDPVVVGCALERQVHFIAKAELFGIPLLGPVIRALGAFPVHRGGGDRKAIRRALELLKQDRVVGIFPEGTRSKSGELLEPHLGAAMLALRAKVPVLPVAVINTRGVFGKVRVRIGKPLVFSRDDQTGRPDYQAVSREIMHEIARLMDSGLVSR